MRLWAWVVGSMVRLLSLIMRREALELKDLMLEGLNHSVTTDLFLDKLFIEDFVDRVEVFVELVGHVLDFGLHLGHDFVGHDFSELALNHFFEMVL